MDATYADDDLSFLRRSFDVARRSREGGDHPFGSVLVGPAGEVLREQGNGFTSEGGDRTAHAERLLSSWAARTFDLGFLQRCTLYSSAEPCAMCSGAIYWAGVGRVVYGQSERRRPARTRKTRRWTSPAARCSPRGSGRRKSSARCWRRKRRGCRRTIGPGRRDEVPSTSQMLSLSKDRDRESRRYLSFGGWGPASRMSSKMDFSESIGPLGLVAASLGGGLSLWVQGELASARQP